MDNGVLKESTAQYDKELAKGVNNTDTPEVDRETKNIKYLSETTYLNIVQDVVNFSKSKLEDIHTEKHSLRSRLIDFCLQILGLQVFFLIIFLMFSKHIGLTDNVLSVYMTAVFVETLGAVIVMIKYAFKSEEEVNVIAILNAVVANFQKYKEEKQNPNKNQKVD